MTLAPMGLVWATIQGVNKTADRPCIVISVDVATVEVVYGQSRPFQGCSSPVQVRIGSLLAQRLGLRKETYFSDWQVIPRSAVVAVKPDDCPASTFIKVEAVAVEARRRHQ